jgi:mono/diheme cytochrome c family protein
VSFRFATIAAALLSMTACATREQRGQMLYAAHGCAVCHGPAGRGDGPSARHLDVPPQDFSDPRAYSQGSSPAAIATSIRRGAGAMPPFRDLTEEEALNIALWIVSQQRRSDAADTK